MVRVRVVGRTLRPGCLASRRFFLGTLGVESLRAPRSQNPYALARKIRRALQHNEDVLHLRRLATSVKKRGVVPPVNPDADSPEPAPDLDHAAAAE